jgi:hypothetical protein
LVAFGRPGVTHTRTQRIGPRAGSEGVTPFTRKTQEVLNATPMDPGAEKPLALTPHPCSNRDRHKPLRE